MQNIFKQDINRSGSIKKSKVPFQQLRGMLTLLLIFSALFSQDKYLSHPVTEPEVSRGRDILLNNVKYSLNYIGLRLFDPIENQEDNTIVYKLNYREVTDKILLPIQQVLTQNNLQAGKLTIFPDNQGFSYRVLYEYKHIGNLIVLNEKKLSQSKKFVPTSPQPKIEKQPAGEKGKMAIIIDDFGYSDNSNVTKFLDLNLNLTISIIPGHKYSTWTSNQAKSRNKEVIIHMPMESDNYHLNNGEGRFLISDAISEKEIIERIEKATINIPDAIGMNNHMGSVATTQPDVVLAVIKGLKKKNLYFIDSLTSPLSIMYENCVIYDVPTARRRFFLDNDKDTGAIINQLRKALKYAQKHGKVIVTGHTYNETLAALNYLMENGEFADVEICPASELLN